MSSTSLWIGLAALLGLYLLYNIFFVLLHEKILFQSDEVSDDYEFSFTFQHEEILLSPSENVRLHGLLLKSDSSNGLVLYFHGNRGHLGRWGRIADEIRTRHGYDVLAMDYRGYGKSRGERSEPLLYQDAELVYDYAQELGYDHIIIYGRSLGTAIATHLAAKRKASHLILETPMTTLREVIPTLNFLLLYKSGLKYEFNSLSRIDRISCPITIFHGMEDAVVPYELGHKLYVEASHSDKKIITIKEGKHNNLDTFDIYQQAMERILN
ncbi:hypothetical protein SAMN04488029_3945 [Reichenbachiella faecimaris]|uniref:Serine aminopeptidase S33 domain-containing protein n=1 Tax=Reichenbachiella faecimaris TaxID=692418 RepID=A0A1W2GQN0_REIFA|nr:alpha/beta fold hydrolase [Reichenbachiella faecimaris]SMD38921.1 hypothetical protein SAMN04488029_3945 [Reichenbachiella faecimaris]